MTTKNATTNNVSEAPLANLPVHLLQALFDHAVDGLIVLDSQRTVVYMNRAAVMMTGKDMDAVGLHCGDLLQCHTDENKSLPLVGCYGQCVLSSKMPMTNIEMNIVTQSGETLPVAVTYSYIPTTDGESYLLMSLRDISDKKRLEQELRQKEELRYTLQERERLARDLHDGVVQDIAYVNMQAKMLAEDLAHQQLPAAADLKRISAILDQIFVELRQAIYDLTFRVNETLHDYIQRYLVEFQTRAGIQVEFHHRDVPKQVPPHIVSQTVKILQEALANVRKHAKASQVKVTLVHDSRNNTLTLTIEDNGCGFESNSAPRSGHFGLTTMKERAELIGGNLSVTSAIGQGTVLHLHIPLG
jgi:PAS domain S-box-containing protein